MKRRIEWSTTAQTDLRQIHQWISRDSRVYAARMIRRIRLKVSGVRQFPEAASRVAELESDEVREIFEGPYRIIFEFDQLRITVLTIVHGSRLLESESDPADD